MAMFKKLFCCQQKNKKKHFSINKKKMFDKSLGIGELSVVRSTYQGWHPYLNGCLPGGDLSPRG